jgi:hypothetical protein
MNRYDHVVVPTRQVLRIRDKGEYLRDGALDDLRLDNVHWDASIEPYANGRRSTGSNRIRGLTLLVEVEGDIHMSRDAMRTATPVTNRGIWRHATAPGEFRSPISERAAAIC